MTRPGDLGSREFTVSDQDTSVEMGSGDVPVLATPRVIAWLEAAAVAALHSLPDGTTSVGVNVSVDHVAPSPVGATVRTEATVRRFDGARVEFTVLAREGDRIVAEGTHTRVLVDRQRFLDRSGR